MSCDLGRRIQACLDMKGMSRRELAAGVGVTEVAIGRYISGEREPKAITVAAIADVLGISIDELMGREAVDADKLDDALQLVARSAAGLSAEKKKALINALIG